MDHRKFLCKADVTQDIKAIVDQMRASDQRLKARVEFLNRQAELLSKTSTEARDLLWEKMHAALLKHNLYPEGYCRDNDNVHVDNDDNNLYWIKGGAHPPLNIFEKLFR